MTSAMVIRRAPSVTLMIDFAEERGLPAGIVLQNTGLSRELLLAADASVTREQELAVIANLVTALGDAVGLGIAVGRRYHITTHGIWGYALISSQTLGDAIDLGLRYLDLSFSYCRIVAVPSGDAVSLVVDPASAPAAVQRFVAERDVGIIDALRSELVGAEVPLLCVQLPYPAPSRTAREDLTHLLGTDVQFGAPHYAACFSAASVELALPLANPHTAAMAEEQCRALLERASPHAGLAGQVRGLLLGNPARPLPADKIAAVLYLTPRTFRRRLGDEGTTYRELLDDVRKQVAEELLGQTRLSVAEVADRIGYAETASFTHAFRRWTGMAPRGFRASVG